jgi:uncharacterized membrane protein (UPF0127 family)
MVGQALLTIKDRQWAVDIANTPWEQSKGLGGVITLPSGIGMLFDMGYEKTIEVTTVPMLFPLDIVFLSDAFVITEIYRNIEPGYLVTSQQPTRYFLEVNAGELVDIEAGSQTEVILLSMKNAAVSPDYMSLVFGFMGFMVMGIFMINIVRKLTAEALKEPERKPVLYGPRGEKLLTQTRNDTTHEKKPYGTCYTDAWRFLVKEGKGKLVHGTVYSGDRRIGHAWVETETGWIWEPQTSRYFTKLGFRDVFAPDKESHYTAEEAAIMVARAKHFGPWTEEERHWYLKDKSPAVIEQYKRQPEQRDNLDLLSDSPEFLAYTIDDIGFREIFDSTFHQAISRAKGNG